MNAPCSTLGRRCTGTRLAQASVVASLVIATFVVAPAAAFGDPAQSVGTSRAYAALPLSFEANAGQASADVQFLARADGSTLYLTRDRAMLSLGASSAALVGMEIVGRDNGAASPQGRDPRPGRVNYLDGPEVDWVSDVPTFGSVRYDGIYPGIDLVYHGLNSQLEYDFEVAPGAAVADIGVRFSGIDGMTLQPNGDLLLETRAGNIVHRAPIAYQESAAWRLLVPSAYELDGDQVSFSVGDYDMSRELVIDPVFSYSTYLGGKTGDTATRWPSTPRETPMSGDARTRSTSRSRTPSRPASARVS